MEIQVALARESRQTMLFVEDLVLTYDEPGPKIVDLKEASLSALNQLLYNWRRGVIQTDNPEALQAACGDVPAAAKNWQTPVERPIENKEVMKQIEGTQRKDGLEKLLNNHWNTVRKLATDLPLAQTRELLELEKKGKKRKALIKFFKKQLLIHKEAVQAQVGSEDLKGEIYNPDSSLTNVGKVEESEEKQVMLIPSELELSESDG